MRFFASLWLLGWACAPFAFSQATWTARDLLGGGTLPQSNEAILLSSQAQQALAAGDYRLAIELIERIRQSTDGLAPAPAGRTCYPLWREALRLQDMLPPDARTYFRDRFDAEVRGRFERARRAGNLSELLELFHQYAASSSWPAIGEELTHRLLDRGSAVDALEVLELLAEKHPTPEIAAQRAIALAALGALGAARQALDPWDRRAAELGQAWAAKREILEEWLQQKEAARRVSPDLAAALAAGGRWSCDLAASGAREGWEGDNGIVDAIERLRRLPALSPQLVDDQLMVRARGTIWALDALTLTPRWSVNERGAPQPLRMVNRDEGGATPPVSIDAELLVEHSLRHSLSAGEGRLYSIEGLALRDPLEGGMGFPGGFIGYPPNQLVCRDVRSGEPLWEVGADSRESLFNVAFQDAPVVLDGAVCAPVRRGNELLLVKLDAATGKLLRQVVVIGPPTYFTVQGGRCLVVADEATVYVATGNGVVAAFAAEDLSWKWAAPYESTLARQRGRRWWNRAPVEAPEYSIDRPVLAEDLLLVAPADSETILALDRCDGRQRWPALDRTAQHLVIGAGPEGILLAGTHITCVDRRDGQQIRWRSVPLELVGRPVLRGERIYAPARDGLRELDARTGKIVADSTGPAQAGAAGSAIGDVANGLEPGGYIGAAICVDQLGVLSVSPNGVTRYLDPDAARHAVADRGAQDPARRLVEAWCAFLSKQPDETLRWLEGLELEGAELAASRDRLMMQAFVAQALAAPDARTRLEWLLRVERMSLGEQAEARLSLLIGRALDDAGDLPAALDHYANLLERHSSVLLRSSQDSRLATAAWRIAGERLRAQLAELSPLERESFLMKRFEGSAGSEIPSLGRWLHVVDDPSLRQRVAQQIVLGEFPYEWVASCIGLPDPADVQESSVRRRFELAQWAAATAVGDFAAAKQAAERCSVWADPLLSQPDDAAEASALTTEARVTPESALRGLCREVQRDYRKLQQDQLAALGVDGHLLRWRRPATELMLPGLDESPANQFVLLQNHEAQRLELVNTHSGDSWRVTPARLLSDRSGAVLEDALDELQSAAAKERPIREFSPLVHERGLAAVPVPGGIVALGLGAFSRETRAGTRLWEARIAGWEVLPADASEAIAAGPPGVFVLTPAEKLRLIGWCDGQVWWERDLSRQDVQKVQYLEGALILTTRDQDAIALDAFTGLPRQDLSLALRGSNLVRIAGGRILSFSNRSVRAIDPHGGEVLWTSKYEKLGWQVLDPAGEFLALREGDEARWSLLRVADGTALNLDPILQEEGELVAMARQNNVIFAVHSGQKDDRPVVTVQAVAADTGRRLWRDSTNTHLTPHVNQLIGSPLCIPILVENTEDDEHGANVENLQLKLIDKATGQAGDPLLIGKTFPAAGGPSPDPLVWVNSSRVLVQASGAVAAWGRSSWGDEP